MFPKSTAKLKPGDACLVPRDDGRFVPLIFICSPTGKRSAPYVGLLSVVLESNDISLVPDGAKIGPWALIHISAYRENKTPIVGNLATKVGLEAISEVALLALDRGIGAKQSVWGYKTIVKYANSVVV